MPARCRWSGRPLRVGSAEYVAQDLREWRAHARPIASCATHSRLAPVRVATIDKAAGIDDVVPAHKGCRVPSAARASSWRASWLLAAPATISAWTSGMVSAVNSPPSAQGGENIDVGLEDLIGGTGLGTQRFDGFADPAPCRCLRRSASRLPDAVCRPACARRSPAPGPPP